MFAHEKRTAQNPRRFREPTRKTTVAFHCSTFRFRMGLHGSIWSRLTEKKQPSRSPEYLDTVGVTGSNRVSRTRRSVMLAYTYVLRCCDGDMYVGSTLDLKRRVIEHEEGKVPATAHRRPLELV
jgi:GIY-YIG catalytic domain